MSTLNNKLIRYEAGDGPRCMLKQKWSLNRQTMVSCRGCLPCFQRMLTEATAGARLLVETGLPYVKPLAGMLLLPLRLPLLLGALRRSA